MLKNYLKTATRSLWNQKSTALINLAGLTLGIAAGLVLFLMIRHMSSFDNYHSKRDRIYRVVTASDGNSGKDYTSGVPTVLHDAFRNDFPEAEEVSFISYPGSGLVSVAQPGGESKKYDEEKGITFLQPNFFKIFDRKVLSGDISKALDEPNEAVISRKSALKYFGREDVLGEVVKYDNHEYKITAVVEDFPSNTDLPFNLMMSYVTIKKEKDEAGWHSIWSNENCYFLLKKNESLAEVERRMPAFTKKYLGEDSRRTGYLIQSFKEVHFDERFSNYNYNTVSRGMLSILALIAVFLIVTACINFINLSTAEAIKRSKEVGIRKSLGSTRQQLIAQFLGESGLVTGLATVLAVICAAGALSFLNPFLDESLEMNFFSDAGLWIFLVGVFVGVTGLSGLYPSLVVSGFNPVLALKNKMSNRNSSGFNLRRGLVVMQFFISQFFIIGTIVLVSQMNYFGSKDLGFKKDAIINVPIPTGRMPSSEEDANKMHALREEVSRINGVELVSLNNAPPSSGTVNGSNFSIEGNPDDFETQIKMVDGNYLKLYGLTLIAGENIQDLDTARGFVVNEKLAAMTGHKNSKDILGSTLKLWGKKLPVVGVVKDFHTVSLREAIEPTVMFNRIKNYRTLSIKLDQHSLQSALKNVQLKWEATYPDFIFSYQFMDDQIKEFYESEKKMSVLLSIFTSLAIFIGCLGLFGLASFMANQKTKEIGIRKVLGASVESIVILFSKEYVKLIFVAFVLASPLAWYVMNQWLSGFEYKIEMGPLVFIAGLAITLLLALLTVGYRSFRAAAVNPTQSLKSE
jgi:putative ABC transport system permease protein